MFKCTFHILTMNYVTELEKFVPLILTYYLIF
jgi:hypothetical protein